MMKNILFAFMMGFLMMACSESSNSVEPTPVPENDKISFASGTNLSPTFDVEGGTVSISFTTSKPWTASLVNNRADGWCKVEPASGPAGTHSISIKVSQNEEPDEKSAVVQIKSGNATETINVSQKQKNTLTLTSNKYEVDAKGGSIEIEIKSNIKYSYSITDKAKEWIAYESSRALATSYLKFKISPNESLTAREGIITISDGVLSEIVTIYQQGEKPSIIISQKDYTIGADADTIQVEVSSNVNVEMQMPDVDWIVENQSRAYSTNTYHFIVSANETYDNRSAEIIFKNVENNLEEKVVINQMQRNAIVLAKNEYTLEKEACRLDFDVQANVAFDVKVESDWIKQAESRGLESHSLYFDVAENTGDDEREGNIVISSGDIEQVIKVIQRGKTVDVEKIAEYIVEVSEKVDPLFMGCETIEELATHLDEIKSMEGVADAWVTNTALFVKTEGGFFISWLYTLQDELEEESEETTCGARAVYGNNISYDLHKYNDGKKACIINQQANDLIRVPNKVYYNALETNLHNAGYDVTRKDGQEANLEFFYNELSSFDLIFMMTHGSFSDKYEFHSFCTGEEWDLSENDSLKNLSENDSLKNLFDLQKICLTKVKETCLEFPFIKTKHYISVTPLFIQDLRGNFNNSIIFNSSCQSLKANQSLADAFISKKAGVYIGYDESNCMGKKTGPLFFEYMLQGMTVLEAYENLGADYQVDNHFNHCAKLKFVGNEDICIVHPEVETLDVTEVKSDFVTLNARINNWRNIKIEIGFCYSKDNEFPEMKNGIKYDKIDYSIEDSVNINFNSVNLNGLEAGTTYYYRAYMNINGQYIYGDVKNFTTTTEEPTTVAEAVDLGLSVLWASHNVGATKPEEYGGYYAWGETEEKERYTLLNYQHYKISFVDIGDNISNTEYDVAHVKWGDGWRIPTLEEIEELASCRYERIDVNGIECLKFIGKNGNNIVLPQAGGKSDKFSVGEDGIYWSSTILKWNDWETEKETAYLLYDTGIGGEMRYHGFPIRPVKSK